jgi:membrane protein YqaA with SNARE-associated domain
MTATTILALFAAPGAHRALMQAFFRYGLVGLFFISIVDSSFVPLPIPGVTDIMIVIYAAAHANLFLLIGIATAGSAIGGFFSHMIGRAGGARFLEQHVPKRIYKRVTQWMERNAILSVALPAILPPPMPLSPFVLAAGAAHMSRRKFMVAFTLSRFARHCIAAWLGVVYGKAVLHLWRHFADRWGLTILIVFWSLTVIFVAFAIWRLMKTSRSLKIKPGDALRGVRQRTEHEAA